MSAVKMSKTMREHLEYVLSSLFAERPYTSYDAERRLIDILGYAVDAEGEQISREDWYKR